MCGQQEKKKKSWWRWIYQRSKNGQKGGVESCEVNRWEDRAELFPPLRPCSPHRHLHTCDNHMEESQRWGSHASDGNNNNNFTKTQQKQQQQGIISAPSLLLLTLGCPFLRIHTAARSLRRCFLSCARGFSPLRLWACNDWERNAAGFIYPSKNNSPPHCLVGPDWQPPAANSVPAPLEAPPLPRVSAPP